MDEESKKAIKKAWQLTVVKDDPEDTLWDTLMKIGELLYPVVTRNDIHFAELAAHAENEKFDRLKRDEDERALLWAELEKLEAGSKSGECCSRCGGAGLDHATGCSECNGTGLS